MSFGNLDDLLAGYNLERKIKHWKKMASNRYLPKRRSYIKKGWCKA